MTEPRFSPQPELALLRVDGADARRFLHAQTTQRIDDMSASETRLAAWLNAKGRIFALFDIVPDGDGFWLVLPADNAAATAATLGRFVLRDKVTIAPAPGRAVFALFDEGDLWLAARGIELPPRGVAAQDGVILFRLGPGRVDLIGEPAALEAWLGGLARAEPDEAARAAIALGRPEIPASLAERYIPQLLNLDRQGAVSFTKGCYPGQEIVARTQNLGQVKRRLMRFRTGAGARPEPGDAIVGTGGEPAGEINRAAAADRGFELLAVVPLDADSGALALGDGRALEPLPIPSL